MQSQPRFGFAARHADFALVWATGACYRAFVLEESSRVTMTADNPLDDTALVRAIAVGDKAAFEQLYGRHGSMLFSLALRILVDRADAEDVLQEVFVQIWKTARSFDETRGKPLSWLIMLTRSRAIDRLRSRQTRTRVLDAAGLEPSDDSPLPGQEASASETRSIVRRAIQTLPAEQRTPIELAYFDGLTQTEIAAQLSQPLGTIKTRMRNGLLRLREQLAQTGGVS